MLEEKRYTRTGEYHEQNEQENQDVVFSASDSRFEFIAVADGVSESENGKKGAEIACEIVSKLFFEVGDLMFDYSELKVSYLILEEIQYQLKQKAEQTGVPLDSYASTMSFCCVDKKKKRMMLFNIGDSAAIITDGSGENCSVESQQTKHSDLAFITTPEAYKSAKVVFYDEKDIENMNTVFLCSDGVLRNIMENGMVSETVKKAIANGEYEQLNGIIEAGKRNDDRSYISIDLGRF